MTETSIGFVIFTQVDPVNNVVYFKLEYTSKGPNALDPNANSCYVQCADTAAAYKMQVELEQARFHHRRVSVSYDPNDAGDQKVAYTIN